MAETRLLDLAGIRAIVGDIEFDDWTFYVWAEHNRPILQVGFNAPDNLTGEPSRQYGRKWFLSPHMTKSEVITTALKAVLTAVEHEARERFLYRGRAVFGPHLDVDALWHVADHQDLRTEGAA